jgi:hypothetical protein
VRSTASVTSSGSHHKLENIDWNQQQGRRSETVSPEGQKPPEQVSLCHPRTSQRNVMFWNHTDEQRNVETAKPKNYVYIFLLSKLCSFGSTENLAFFK